ncbi:monocarboxylate transporter 12 [Elysia marginata]|uniref:Monocarboxylate transporter 12 n=1 Tax=Elysia marginata TaxID=1093978 RepID=A0AAV4HR97_9GAST|nr:monocarboxylate transporter 12 [Elysia marginata]
MGTHGRRVIVPGNLVSKRPSKLLTTPGTPSAGCEADIPLLKTMLHYEISRSSHSVNRSIGKSALNKSSSDICSTLSPTPILEGHEWLVPRDTIVSISQNHLSSAYDLSPSSNTLNSLALTSPYSRYQNGHHQPSSQSQFLLSQGSHSQYTSNSHISARLSLRSGFASTAPRGEMDNESVTSTFVSNLRPYDVISPRQPLGSRSISTLLGSVASFPTSLAIVKDDLRRFEPTTPYDGSLKGYAIAALDSMRILRNKPFCIFLSTNFFWALGESPVLIHLPSYVVSRGTTPLQASSLYTSMGIASMAGRFLSGLIASDVNIGPVLMYTGSLGVAGLVVVLSPLMTNTFGQQVGFSFLVGLYTGALVPLTSLITIELLGISELSLGFGLISMAQGLGYLIGPPLSSIVVKAVGFVNAFVSSGFVLMGGSLLTLSMTLFLTVGETDVDEDLGLDVGEQHSLDEFEKALQKLAKYSSGSDLDGAGNDEVCGDSRSHTSERSHLNAAADKTAVGEDTGRNMAHSKDNGSSRTKENLGSEGMQGIVTPSDGESNSVGEHPWGSSSGISSAYRDENSPAPPLRVFDELDTIVEVVGK